MTNPAIFPAIGFVGAAVFLFYLVIYRQQRKQGCSHEASLSESVISSVLLLGSAVIDYMAVVASYS